MPPATWLRPKQSTTCPHRLVARYTKLSLKQRSCSSQCKHLHIRLHKSRKRLRAFSLLHTSSTWLHYNNLPYARTMYSSHPIQAPDLSTVHSRLLVCCLVIDLFAALFTACKGTPLFYYAFNSDASGYRRSACSSRKLIQSFRKPLPLQRKLVRSRWSHEPV